MFLQVFSFIYDAFWISVEAENVVEVAVVFVGHYLRCTSLLYASLLVADEIGRLVMYEERLFRRFLIEFKGAFTVRVNSDFEVEQ